MHDSSQSSRRGQSDVFRPRLPLDPFSPAPSPRAPDTARVLVDPDAPWPTTDLQLLAQAFAGAPHVVLVLGSPAPHLLAPLLRSHTFARCLLLLVTHAPPPLSALRSAAAPLPLPQTRILRLRTPLDPAAPAFALELVSVLDAAANVAREWRVAPDDDDVVQLAQGVDGAAFVVREVLPSSPGEVLPTSEHRHPPAPRRSLLGPSPSYPANRTRPPSSLSLVSTASAPSRSFFSRRGSDASSASNASTSRPTRNRRDSASSAFSAKSSSSTLSKSSPNGTKRDSRRESTLTAQTRPFDALLSFLPPAQQEKAVLKQVVLVTTLAAAFLAGAGPRSVGMDFSHSPSASAPSSRASSRPNSRPNSFVGEGPGSAYNNSGGAYNNYPNGGGTAYSEPTTPASWGQHSSAFSAAAYGYPSSGETSRAGSRAGSPSPEEIPGTNTERDGDADSRTDKKRSGFFSFGRAAGARNEAARSVDLTHDTHDTNGHGLAHSASVGQLNGGTRGGQPQLNGHGISTHANGGIGTRRHTRAHIVHVLPATYRSRKLTGAVGAFCAGQGQGGGGPRASPRAYVLAERALRDVESVLVGALDLELESGQGGRTAWVAGVVPASAPGSGSGPSTPEEEEGEEGGDADRHDHDHGHDHEDVRQGEFLQVEGAEDAKGKGKGKQREGSERTLHPHDGPHERERTLHAPPHERDRTLHAPPHDRDRERTLQPQHPYGLPTPPASRSGSGEGSGEAEGEGEGEEVLGMGLVKQQTRSDESGTGTGASHASPSSHTSSSQHHGSSQTHSQSYSTSAEGVKRQEGWAEGVRGRGEEGSGMTVRAEQGQMHARKASSSQNHTPTQSVNGHGHGRTPSASGQTHARTPSASGVNGSASGGRRRVESAPLPASLITAGPGAVNGVAGKGDAVGASDASSTGRSPSGNANGPAGKADARGGGKDAGKQEAGKEETAAPAEREAQDVESGEPVLWGQGPGDFKLAPALPSEASPTSPTSASAAGAGGKDASKANAKANANVKAKDKAATLREKDARGRSSPDLRDMGAGATGEGKGRNLKEREREREEGRRRRWWMGREREAREGKNEWSADGLADSQNGFAAGRERAGRRGSSSSTLSAEHGLRAFASAVAFRAFGSST
ncbi:hypothetical protein C8R43DRAFT_956962 [Mycena crocata]|nr:hypothetical protein C8R43DRAFT_956962 [Mycena crocata]